MLSFKQFLIEKAQSPESEVGTSVILPNGETWTVVDTVTPDDYIEDPTIQQWMQQLGRRPSSWGQWPYGDHDGDGIPNINDRDSGSYNPVHPESDQDLDGIPNWMDPNFPGHDTMFDDDDGDGIINLDDEDSDDYMPGHPLADPDGDGVPNDSDPDDDNDGILDDDDDSQWGDVFDPDEPQIG
jgi:hypothetical protein